MRIKLLTLFLFLGLVFPLAAQASSVYLTLQGTVNNSWQMWGNVKDSGVNVGDTLTYVVEVDTDKIGYHIQSNGQFDHTGSYYTSLSTGNLLGNVGNEQQKWGDGSKGSNSLYTQTSNEYSTVVLNSWVSSINSLEEGSIINSLQESSYINGKNTGINLTNVVVTSISNAAPTPIGASGLMLIGGLGVVGFMRRRFTKSA